mgnify:CR=1 FL=1|jgi:signal recognition particle receptor subunit beta
MESFDVHDIDDLASYVPAGADANVGAAAAGAGADATHASRLSPSFLRAVHDAIASELAEEGVPIALFYALFTCLLALLVTIAVNALFGRFLFGKTAGETAAASAATSKPGSGDAVLLAGACGAGKTSLLMALRGSASTLGTVTSMDVNDASVTVEDARGKKTKSGSAATTTKRARVVDLPGHPRLRAKIDAHASRARGVVFVLDAVDFAANRGEVAERLHALLADPAIRKRRVPFLVACNKSEKIAAHPVDFVRKRLEKEIETLVRSILHWFPYDRVGVVNAVS